MGVWRVINVTQANANKTGDVMLETVSLTNQQPCELATAVFSCTADAFDEGDEYKFEFADDNTNYVTVSAGDISVKTLTQFEGNTPFWEYQGRDFTARLDDTIITAARNTTEDPNDRITWIFSQGEDFGITTGGVAAFGGTVGPFDYSGLSRREALAQVAGLLAAVFYVDFDKELQFYNADLNIPAAFDLDVDAPSAPDSYSFRDFNLDYDRTDADIDAVWVQGDGTNAWVPAEPTSGQRARSLQANDTKLLADLTFLGEVELERIGAVAQSGRLVTFRAGLLPGTTVNITDPAHADLSAGVDFIINSTTVTPFPPSAADYTWGYRCDVRFSDRLACIPRRDVSRQTQTVKDCTDCTRTVAILPSGMDENISLAEGRGHMFAFDGADLAKYDCSVTLVAEATPGNHDLNYIDHEPVYEALMNGDAALYVGTVGAFGDDRWTISAAITAGKVMDIRKAWLVNFTQALVTDTFTRTTTSPELGTTDTGEAWKGPNNIADNDAGAVSGGATIRADSANFEYVGGTDGEKTLRGSGKPWDQGNACTLLLTDLRFTFGSNADRICQFSYQLDAEDTYFSINQRASDGKFILEIQTDTDVQQSAAVTLTTATNYSVRWERVPSAVGGYSRARIWASAGSEPSTWDVEAESGDESGAGSWTDGFSIYCATAYTVEISRLDIIGGATLERRDMTDGTEEAEATLTRESYNLRPTPNRQHVFLDQGDWNNSDNAVLERYSRTPGLEDSVTMDGFYVDIQDWAVADDYTIYLLQGNVLTRYDSDGTELWDLDLNALYDYRWPSRASWGSATGIGQTVLAFADAVFVCGYEGPADWTDGSTGVIYKLDPEFGERLDRREFTTTGGNAGSQVIGMEMMGPCLWACGAADGTSFEGNTISGVNGWIAKMPRG